MANEALFTIPLIGSAIWTAVTGDTFLPALVGAGFAVHFRHEREGGSSVSWRDVIGTVIVSVLVGILAGPWLADQLPEGRGVVGVGALVASFVGVPLFRALSRVDMGEAIEWLVRTITGGRER